MQHRAMFQSDYDQKVKIEKRAVFCYSGKQLRKKHPDRDFVLSGELLSNKAKDQEDTIVVQEMTLPISPVGKHSRLLYQEVGYLKTDDGTYIAILKNRIPFLMILVLLLAALILTGWMIYERFFNDSIPTINPYHPLPKEDIYVTENKDDEETKIESEEGGGSVSMIYTLTAELSLDDGKIAMYFKNPNASNQDVMIELYLSTDQGEILIAKSGRIPTGYTLTQMDQIKDAAILQEGQYPAFYKVRCYNSLTGERALVAPTIQDITVNVRNTAQ